MNNIRFHYLYRDGRTTRNGLMLSSAILTIRPLSQS